MALRLVIGPARSGKLGVVARAFLAALERGERPVLVAPERAPRCAGTRAGGPRRAIAGGEVITWDALCNRVLTRTGGALPAAPDALRGLLLRRAAAQPGGPGGLSAALGRLADEAAEAGLDGERLAGALREADAGHMADVLGRLARRARACRAVGPRRAARRGRPPGGLAPGRVGRAPRARLRLRRPARRAARAARGARGARRGRRSRSRSRPAARPMRRSRLPFERTWPSAPTRSRSCRRRGWRAPRAWTRSSAASSRTARPPPHTDGAGVRLIEAAGTQAEADAVAGEIAALLRAGLAPGRDLVVVPSPERARGALTGRSTPSACPTRSMRACRWPRTPLRARAAGALPLRLARRRAARTCSPGCARRPRAPGARRSTRGKASVRGRGRTDARESYELVCELAGRGSRRSSAARRRRPARRAARRARGERTLRVRARRARAPRRARRRRRCAPGRPRSRTLRALDGADPPPATDEIASALETTQVRVGDDRPSGRVRVVALARLRAHRAAAVFVLGLEEGVLPGRDRPDALRTDEVRAALERSRRLAAARSRGLRPLPLHRGRRARHAGCSSWCAARRPTTARRSTPSPFWNEARRALDGGAPPVERRGLGELTQPLEIAPVRARAPARRRAHRGRRSACWPRASPRPTARPGRVASCARARAFSRPTRHRRPRAPARARPRACATRSPSSRPFSTARRAGSSSARSTRATSTPPWMRRPAAASPTPRCNRFFTRLPAALGTESLVAADLARAEPLLREVIAESLAAVRLPQDSLPMLELGPRPAARPARVPPLRGRAATTGSCRAGWRSRSASAASPPGLKDGLVLGDFAVSGRIDRIDVGSALGARPDPGLQVLDPRRRRRRHREAAACCSCRSTSWRCASCSGSSRSAASTARSATAGEARGCCCASAREDGAEGFNDRRLPRRGVVRGAS